MLTFKVLRSEFKNNLIYIILKTHENESLRLFTDTGGARSTYINLQNVPNVISYFPRVRMGMYNGKNIFGDDVDGVLGCQFFDKRIWNINYIKKTISICDSNTYKIIKNKIPIYINPKISYPSFQVEIYGEKYWFLIDTGATMMDKKGIDRAISFITKQFIKKLIENGNRIKIIKNVDKEKQNMVVIPEIKIGKFVIKNSKFIIRPSKSEKILHEMTHKSAVGAIGGNILKSFNIILNYPEKYVWMKQF